MFGALASSEHHLIETPIEQTVGRQAQAEHRDQNHQRLPLPGSIQA
jgi:hypothetical protein